MGGDGRERWRLIYSLPSASTGLTSSAYGSSTVGPSPTSPSSSSNGNLVSWRYMGEDGSKDVIQGPHVQHVERTGHPLPPEVAGQGGFGEL